ncbi:hypothetical protein FE63_15570, partial [Staphylococcus aureus]
QDNQSISKKMTGYGLKTTAVIWGGIPGKIFHDQPAFWGFFGPINFLLKTPFLFQTYPPPQKKKK